MRERHGKENRIKLIKTVGVFLFILVYTGAAIGTMYWVYHSGSYPSGTNTMAHLYKANQVYQSICAGDWWPAYDSMWYNGVEALRYWAPIPIYLLAACQAMAGGSMTLAYIIYVAFALWMGAVIWLVVGLAMNRLPLGGFIGLIWFFMPYNLQALFEQGNLPGSIAVNMIPLLLFFIYSYLETGKAKWIPVTALTMAFIVLCQIRLSLEVLISLLVFLLLYGLIERVLKRAFHVLLALVGGFMLTGLWLVPALTGGETSVDAASALAEFFQSITTTLNPFTRLSGQGIYFGLSAAFLCIFGIIFARKKAQAGFWTAMIILLATTNTAYIFINVLPGSGYLRMIQYVSIALTLILFSLLVWKQLKKIYIVGFAVLLILDCLPSASLVYGDMSDSQPEEAWDSQAGETLISEAREITDQRMILIDDGNLGAEGAFLISGYGDDAVASSGGSYEQTAATTSNVTYLNRALSEGNFLYLFDRALDLGDDVVLVDVDCINDILDHPVSELDEDAEEVGYELIDWTEEYRLYKYDVDSDESWGTITDYDAIAIGDLSYLISMEFPCVKETNDSNLSDYTYDDLSQYSLVILTDFTYDDKEVAESLILKLSQNGTKVIVMADGIPQDRESRNQSFLGVVANDVTFEKGFPDLDTIDGVLDTDLFPNEYSTWDTVYVEGLDEVWGTVLDEDVVLPFYGCVKNENIVVIGLNLTYYCNVTQDQAVCQLMSEAFGIDSKELPERQIVPIQVTTEGDTLTIESDYDDVNTGLAYLSSFVTGGNIWEENNLTYVNSGQVTIRVAYPNFMEGLMVSLVGIAFLTLISKHVSKRMKEGIANG